MSLSCSISVEDRVSTVTVVGDVDISSTSILRDALREALARADTDMVVVDLAGVAFIDSTAVGVLVAGRRAAELGARSFAVSRPGPMVTMVLRLTGLYDILVAEPAGA